MSITSAFWEMAVIFKLASCVTEDQLVSYQAMSQIYENSYVSPST